MSDWGQGSKNNDIGWGQGAVNNDISWGASHKISWAGDTEIVGTDGNVPVNTVAPVISGTALVGNTLTSTTGTWTSDTGVIGYLYQWTRDGVNISGATNSTYTLVSADLNKSVICKVAATDTDGTSAYVNSNSLVVYDSDYKAVLDYATTQGYTLPSVSQRLKQSILLSSLKTAGVWSKLDAFANFATDGSSNFALIDWKRLSLLTAVNSPTFITNQGFRGNGTSSYIDSNFNPSTQGLNYTQNNAGASIGIFAIPTIGAYALGMLTANSGDIRIRMQTDLSDQMINGALQTTVSGLNSNVTGSLHTDRINSTQIVSQVNNTLGNIATNNATSLPQSKIWLGRIVTSYANMGFNFLALRSSFSKSEKDTFNGIINTYITSL